MPAGSSMCNLFITTRHQRVKLSSSEISVESYIIYFVWGKEANKFSTLLQYTGNETNSFLKNLVQLLFLFFTFSILHKISKINATAPKLRIRYLKVL